MPESITSTRPGASHDLIVCQAEASASEIALKCARHNLCLAPVSPTVRWHSQEVFRQYPRRPCLPWLQLLRLIHKPFCTRLSKMPPSYCAGGVKQEFGDSGDVPIILASI